ncbi:hypothetical protein FRC11_011753 [Ceratobasidium sp. 423]|nr:hypothetical protein FRC11_011753 [Ceratobasidium sp. 423]
MSELAATYGYLGRWEEAEQMQVQALKAFKRILGESRLETLATMDNLGLIYSFLSRQNEAGQQWARALAGYKRVLGEEHPDTDIIRRKTPTYTESHDLPRINVYTLGPTHRDDSVFTVQSLHDLALLYLHCDRWDDTGPLFAEIASISGRRLGNLHPKTAFAKAQHLPLAFLDKSLSHLYEISPITVAC